MSSVLRLRGSSVPRSHRLRLSPRTRRTDSFRLALSHNLLASLPLRLIECKRLRYLNVRYNAMREFPEAVRVPVSP